MSRAVAVGRRGLYDGFEAFRTPAAEEYKDVLRNGMVVIDTNVLLNLYRYTAAARDSLLEVLDRLGERLWVPHHVLAEFWGARESVLRDPRGTAQTLRRLRDLRDKAVGELQEWARKASLDRTRARELQAMLPPAFEKVVQGIEKLDGGPSGDYARDSAADPVLAALEGILADRVGPPFDPGDREAACAEGRRRLDAEIPPGFRDKQKGGDAALGDYLLWRQLLDEARTRKSDVLFVTDDRKDDWWRREGAELRGPRPELIDEVRAVAGRRLYMLRPDGLLDQARRALDVDVAPSSVADAGRVAELLDEREREEETGWSTGAVSALMRRLDEEAPRQAGVIRRAAELGGTIDRAEVFRVGGVNNLRGFLTPVRRITREFQERGLLPAEVPDLLVPDYDADAPFGPIAAYAVPPGAVPLIPTAAAAPEGEE